MIYWMLYVVAVTAILSVAALVAEQAARQWRVPGRWVWAAAIVSSLLVPTVISSVSIELPNLFAPAVTQKLIVLREATAVHLPFALVAPPVMQAMPLPNDADLLLRRLWIAASAGIAIALAISGALVMRRKAQWEISEMCGAQVFVAPNVGPAVVGLIRPSIVVPVWLTRATLSQQQHVIAHEQAHLDAYDPQLLSIALCLLVTMPWNLPLWWQLRRLRRAIEVDCDARVVGSGCRLAEYGATLLAVGQRQSGFVGVAAAMSESTSFLEQRIKIMLKKPAQLSRAAATFLASISLAMFAVAAEVSPPNVGSAEPAHVVLASKVIDGYLGNYRTTDNQVMTVTRDGNRMYVQMTGQPRFEVFASSETEFFSKVSKTRGTVLRDVQGRATAVVLHDKGREDITAPRIDDALAKQINDRVAARVDNQTASPGTEGALRRLIEQTRATPPIFDGMSPALAQAFKDQDAVLHPHFIKLGTVKAIEFVGVTDSGADKYLVRYEHGTAQWTIVLDAKGVIVGAMVNS